AFGIFGPGRGKSKIQNPESKIAGLWPLVLSLWAVPILVFWLVTLRLPLFQPRYLIMALPPYLIMAAGGLLALRRVQPLLAGEAELNDTLRRVVTCHERAWLVTSPLRQQQEDPGNKVQEWFQYNWLTFDTKVFNGVSIYGIAFNGQPNCWFPEPDHREPHQLS